MSHTAVRRTTKIFAGLYLAAMAVGGFAQVPKTIIVGGGPNPQNNQVAIESNVRYMLKILPKSYWKTVLFANGNATESNVLYESKTKSLPESERLLDLIVKNRQSAYPSELQYRPTTISQLDGPSKTDAISDAFDKLRNAEATEPSPMLLYFTGHGSPNRTGNLENNVYDLWGGSTISVKQLCTQIEKLPENQPLTLVMVQCYSGSFANVLFENGDPNGNFTNRDIAGYFATVKEKTAAGCTPALDESEYHDFTSYFFAALTGRDRVGRKVSGADYNRDGKITMDEAYCYTIIHDASIDIPICTSDIFVRKYVKIPPTEIFKRSYKEVIKWANRPQRAVLEELSKELKLSGDDRQKEAFEAFMSNTQPGGNRGSSTTQSEAQRKYSAERNNLRTLIFGKFPDIRDSRNPNYQQSWTEAMEFVGQMNADGKLKDFIEAEKGLDNSEDAGYQKEIMDAKLTRFIRMFNTVALSHILRTEGDPAVKERFEKLVAAESRELFSGKRL